MGDVEGGKRHRYAGASKESRNNLHLTNERQNENDEDDSVTMMRASALFIWLAARRINPRYDIQHIELKKKCPLLGKRATGEALSLISHVTNISFFYIQLTTVRVGVRSHSAEERLSRVTLVLEWCGLIQLAIVVN